MLPDYKRIKEDLKSEILYESQVEQFKQLSPLVSVPSLWQEGDKAFLVRETGKREEISLKESQENIEIKKCDIGNLTLAEIKERFFKMAHAFASIQMKNIFDEISLATESIGNVIEVKGEFKPEDIFEIIKKVSIDFKPNGDPEMGNFFVGPNSNDKLIEVLKIIDSDPAYKIQYDKLIEIKREEWRERENNRKLVG